jgi:hypothetical protein
MSYRDPVDVIGQIDLDAASEAGRPAQARQHCTMSEASS